MIRQLKKVKEEMQKQAAPGTKITGAGTGASSQSKVFLIVGLVIATIILIIIFKKKK